MNHQSRVRQLTFQFWFGFAATFAAFYLFVRGGGTWLEEHFGAWSLYAGFLSIIAIMTFAMHRFVARDSARTAEACENVRRSLARKFEPAEPDIESISTASLNFIPEAELPNKHLHPLIVERARREYRTPTAAFYYLADSIPREWDACQISSIRGSILVYPLILLLTFIPAYVFFNSSASEHHIVGSIWFTFLFPIVCCFALPKLFDRFMPNSLRFAIEPHVVDHGQKGALFQILSVCRRHCAPHEIRVKIQDRQLLILFLTDFRGRDATTLVSELDSIFQIGIV